MERGGGHVSAACACDHRWGGLHDRFTGGHGKAQAGLLRSASSAASGILVLTVRVPSRLRDVLSRHREDQATDGSAQVYERQGDVVHSCGRHGEHMVESATATRALL